jgi:hypothetical protein
MKTPMHVEFGRMPVALINGVFAVYVVRGDSIIASRTGIDSAARCAELAQQYADNYGAPLRPEARFLDPL